MSNLKKRTRNYECSWYTDQELLEIFPEAKKIIPEKIREWKNECEEMKSDIREFLESGEKNYPNDYWFWEIAVAKLFLPKLYKYEGHILRLRRYQNIYKPKKNSRINNYEKFREKIEIAQNYPIAELARDKLELRPSGENFVGLCPFHNERTPSFYLYTNTNIFVCFGCNEKGSVLKLTMHLYGLDFKEAVEMLQK